MRSNLYFGVNGVAKGLNDDEEFDDGVDGNCDDEELDDGVDGNCGEFVADVEEGTFLVGV